VKKTFLFIHCVNFEGQQVEHYPKFEEIYLKYNYLVIIRLY